MCSFFTAGRSAGYEFSYFSSCQIVSGGKSSCPAHSSSVSNVPFSFGCSQGIFFVFSF